MFSSRPKFAAFDQGQTPCIAIIDASNGGYFSGKRGAGPTLDTLVNVFTEYVKLLDAAWGVTCTFEIVKMKTLNAYPKGKWPFLFLDHADVPGALAYHEFTPDGYPICKTFIETTKAAGENPVVSASHELAEALWDPAIQLCYAAPSDGLHTPQGRQMASIVAGEISDAVQGDVFYIDKVPVSNFVFPAWFEAFNKAYKTKYDFMGRCKKPFEIRPGGYMPVMNVNRRTGRLEWSQVFGTKKAAKEYRAGAHHRLGVRKQLDDGKTHKDLSPRRLQAV